MRSSPALLWTLAGATFLVTPGACGFPDVSFEGADASADGQSSAVRRSDASRIAEGGCGPNACDCDEDGNENQGCAAAELADCDDFDPLIKRNQGWVAEPWPAGIGGLEGDWNCDGLVERQYTDDLDCALLGCNGAGFEGKPACGTGIYKKCVRLSPIGCATETGDARVQGCR